MKNKILAPFIALLLITGCDYNKDNFEGLGEMTKPSDIKNIAYVLTDADYKAIADNAANKTLAEKNNESAELAKLTSNKYFAEPITASTYAPAFINEKWYTADNGSAIKLTFNQAVNLPEYVSKLNQASMYKVSNADYQSVWGEGSKTNFFTPLTPARTFVPVILKTALPDAKNGDVAVVDYNESENEPSGSTIGVSEDFNSVVAYEKVAIDGWNNVTTVGQDFWQGRTFSGNGYMNVTANNHSAGELEVYMITPKIKVVKGMKLTFDACYGYYKNEGGRVSVLISSNLQGFSVEQIKSATWDNEATSSFEIEVPSGNYGTLKPVGEYVLDKYAGTDIYIAFRYNGDGTTGATTTVQIDNVAVKSEASGTGEDKYYPTTGLYLYDGEDWSVYGGNTYMLTKADFESMGINYDNFSSSLNPDHYLPTFLKLQFPYAKEGDVKAPTYKYYASSKTTVRADEYLYSGAEWVKNNDIEIVTSQFVKTKGEWVYNPSITIILKPGTNQPDIAAYYQPIVDYVAATHGTDYYQNNYKNAEYYYGCSAHQNNFDFRVSAWRNSNAAGPEVYKDLTDAQLEALMFERLPEAFIPALEKLHGDMKVTSGVDTECTIRFGIYKGTIISDCNYEIVYELIADGKFKYKEGSLRPL